MGVYGINAIFGRQVSLSEAVQHRAVVTTER